MADGTIVEGGGIYYTVVKDDNLILIHAAHPELGYSNWMELRDKNMEAIRSVGLAKAANLVFGAKTPNRPCGVIHDNEKKDHAGNLLHFMRDGIHYDGEEQPTIYPGTTFFIKKNRKEEPPPAKEEPRGEEPEAGEVITGRSGTGMYRVKHQAPAPKITVHKPDKKEPYLTFEAAKKEGGHSQKPLSYSFSGGVDDLYGAFSFSIEEEEGGITAGDDKKTAFDAIPERSVIYIYESDEETPVFIGIVKRRRVKASMTAQGPRRSIVISGKNIISVLAEYMVSLDFKIMDVASAENASRDLTLELNQKELSIQDFMVKTWEFFWKCGTGKEINAIASTTAGKIIAAHIGGIGECIQTGPVKNIYYPIANAPFNQGNNVISELWRNILPQPVYEIYAHCDRKDGKPKIMAREAPFGFKDDGNQDWYSLPIYDIDPLGLIDYDLSRSDEEVYTAFSAYLIGSSFSREYNIAKAQDKKDDTMAKDIEKLDLYGFRPLEISFRGYAAQGADEKELKKVYQRLNKKAAYWFGRLDEMYSGTITIITNFIKRKDEKDINPRHGCRAKFLGGEFYITHAEHRWQYGGAPVITLTITRGMQYDVQGYMKDGDEGVLSDIGKRFKEFDGYGH